MIDNIYCIVLIICYIISILWILEDDIKFKGFVIDNIDSAGFYGGSICIK